MKNFKNLSLFVAIILTFSTALGSFGLPAFAYEKGNVNFKQVKTLSDNIGTILNKLNSISKSTNALSQDLSIIQKGGTGLEKSQQINTERRNYVEGEILVKYKNNKINLQTVSGRATALNFIRSKSLENKEHIRKVNISVLKIKDSKTVEQKIAELKNDPSVEYVEPNYKRYPTVINADDTNRDLLWGLDNIGQTVGGIYSTNNPGSTDKDIDAPEAWAINEGTSASVIVAIIDSGVAYNHPDLVANMWDGAICKDDTGATIAGGCNHGYDYEDGDNTPLPTTSSHGTHIAGTIAAVKNNTKGIIGVAPQAKIMAIKYNSTVFEEVKAIDFAIQNGAKVINASFTGATFSTPEFDAINRFRTAGGIFVAAVGNGGADQVSDNNENGHQYPSDYNLDNIISVAATDQNDTLASFSNYGTTSVDVGAPGVNILSTVPLVSDTNQLNESFESVAQFSIPNSWTQNGSWGVYDRTLDWGSVWGKVLYGDLNYPYLSNANTLTTVPAINLNGATSGFIDFWTACDTEYNTTNWTDYMELEYSADGVTFSPVTDPYFGSDFKWDEPTLDVLSGENPLNNTGRSVFHYENISIPVQYLTSNFKLRFRWVTNASDNSYNGCVVDDVKVIKRVVSSGNDEQYGYMNGTSMAAPHVAGLAALIEGYNPSLTLSQVKNAILNTGDSVASLSGKTVTGKRINAQNALQAVDPAKAITAFSFATPVATGVIDEISHTITLTVPFGTNITALIPTIAISAGASVSPVSGVAQNFTNPVTYTVTAADGSTQAYVVTVAFDTNPDIAKVSADKVALVDNSIKGTNSDLSNITGALTNPLPSTGTNGSTITWASNTPAVVSNDGQTVVRPSFGNANATVILTATITKGVVTDTKTFTLTVLAETVNPDITSPTISSYTLNGSAQNVVFNPNNPASVSIVINADEPVKFTRIKILNGANQEIKFFTTTTFATTATKVWDGKNSSGVVVPDGVYTLQVNIKDVAGNSNNNLNLSPFTITVDTTIPVIILNGVTPDITVGSSYTELGATATDTVDGTFVATPSGSVNTNVVGAYTITYNATDVAGNVATPITRTVNVVAAPLSSAKAITAFNFTTPSAIGVIKETSHTIAVTVPFGTDITTLTPTIAVSTGASVSPPSGVAQDFTNPVTYTVTAENSTIQTYAVAVTIGTNPDIALLAADKAALVDNSIKGTNSDLSNITGALTNPLPSTGTNGSTITWASNTPAVVSNDGQTIVRPAFTASDATISLTATLTRGGLIDTKIFTLIVLKLPASTVATVTSGTYTVNDESSTITGIPYGTSSSSFLAGLIKGESHQTWDNSGLTSPVITGNTLIVTAQDGSTTKTYTLTVALNSAKAITAFSFTTPSVTGVVNEATHTITITVPNATDVTTLVPTITTSTGSSVSPISGVAQDFTSPVTYTVTAADSSTQTYVVSIIVATATQAVPATNGTATVNNTTPQVIITNPIQMVTITISSGTTAPTIDISSFITGGTGTLPEINITSANANNVNVAIPASTIVTSALNTWDGIIAAPTVTTVTLPETSGQTKTLSTAIEVGFTGAELTFNNAVRLLLPGQAGKRAGYTRTGITFTEITNTCSADNQATGDALVAGGECKIDVGSDLVIWTKHFTSFATYTQTTNNTGGGGGGGGGGYTPTPVPTPIIGKKGDANGDGKVDKYDFALIMANWGKTGTSTSDFNSDGKVDKYDFALLMSNWGL